MKNIYFFSKTKLNFVEVKNYRTYLALYTTIIMLATSGLLVGGYFVYNNFINPVKGYSSVKEENRALRSKIKELTNSYKSLESELDTLAVANNELRMAANIPPRSAEAKKPGTGGNIGNILSYLRLGKSWDLSKSFDYIDEVTRRFKNEKEYLNEISSVLASNQGLYRSIPALKPTTGIVGVHGFGMRLHPIYNQYRMHSGIDIITDTGTDVIAPGDGVVTFTGIRGGFGKCIEIDHGYGYQTIYGHLSDIKVKEGKKVKRGSLIAKTGNTGLSVGPHLHYEVINNGVHLDPEQFFFDETSLFSKDNLNTKLN